MTSPPPAPLIAISVLNWRTPALSLDCLDALSRLRYPNTRVMLVDNASGDDSLTRIRAAWPTLDILTSDHNLGFAAGHALAWQQARAWGAAALWLVNSDAQVEADALDELVSAWRTHGDALYGGLPLRRDDSGAAWLDFPAKFLPQDARPTLLRRDPPQRVDTAWQQRPPFRVGALAGSSLLIPLTVPARHGWMDADWFMYCEEIDYCMRLRDQGVPSYLVPASRLWHLGGGSHRREKGVGDCMRYYQTRNEIELMRRHGRQGQAMLLVLKKLARSAWMLPADPPRARAVLSGALDGARRRLGKTLAPEDFLSR